MRTAIARGLDDPETLAYVLNRFCMSFAVPHTLEARRSAAAEKLPLLTVRTNIGI